MPYQYPILLDLSRRSVLIVGGGRVALRKVRTLLDSDARQIRCVAPRIDPQMPSEVQRIAEPYHVKYLDGMDLAFAVTDSPQVNDQVVQDAQMRNIWVCRADTDTDQAGDFILPAKFQRGPITVAVSTSSPAISAAIRDQLSNLLDERWIKLAEAMQLLRPQVLACDGLTGQRRGDALRDLAGGQAMELLDEQGFTSLERWIKNRYPELNVT
ncbi:MAG: bifunctional precorrin-2 dehydrogenase/sirohydrochlorin ferrochelatase [Phycisphaerales bacterium]|nr:bifunctional precorrin-2 dehydrogenase/sirohydrochlorin ferrochelatase [Phycisphaerales bacterium]